MTISALALKEKGSSITWLNRTKLTLVKTTTVLCLLLQTANMATCYFKGWWHREHRQTERQTRHKAVATTQQIEHSDQWQTCRCLRALRVPPNTKNFPVDLVDAVDTGDMTPSLRADPTPVCWSTSMYHVSVVVERERLWLEELGWRPAERDEWFSSPSMCDKLAVDSFRT